MAGYTPVDADDDKYLRVTATYTDAQGSGRPLLECQTRLGRPRWSRRYGTWRRCFMDEDDETDGTQIDPRAVAENSGEGTSVNTAADPATAAPVVATDMADADTGDDNGIFYLLSGLMRHRSTLIQMVR